MMRNASKHRTRVPSPTTSSNVPSYGLIFALFGIAASAVVYYFWYRNRRPVRKGNKRNGNGNSGGPHPPPHTAIAMDPDELTKRIERLCADEMCVRQKVEGSAWRECATLKFLADTAISEDCVGDAKLVNPLAVATGHGERPLVPLDGAAWSRRCVCVSVVGNPGAGRTFVANALARAHIVRVPRTASRWDAPTRIRTVVDRAESELVVVHGESAGITFLDVRAAATASTDHRRALDAIGLAFADIPVIVCANPADALPYMETLEARGHRDAIFIHRCEEPPMSVLDAAAERLKKKIAGLAPLQSSRHNCPTMFVHHRTNSLHVFLGTDTGPEVNEAVLNEMLSRIRAPTPKSASVGDATAAAFNGMLDTFTTVPAGGSWVCGSKTAAGATLKWHPVVAEAPTQSRTTGNDLVAFQQIPLAFRVDDVWGEFAATLDDLGTIESTAPAYVLHFTMTGLDGADAQRDIEQQLHREEDSEGGDVRWGPALQYVKSESSVDEVLALRVTGPPGADGRPQRVNKRTQLGPHNGCEVDSPICVRFVAADDAAASGGLTRCEIQFCPGQLETSDIVV